MRKSRGERPAGLKQAQCGDRLECWPVARIEAVLRIRRSRPLTDHERIGAFGTALAFAVEYAYKPTGQVDSITNLLTTVVSQYAYTDTSSPNAVTSVTEGTVTDSFTYDDAGRMLTRTVDSTLTELAWDVSSNLVATSSPTQDVVYVYDTGGQRVAQISVGDLNNPVPVSATVYFGATQVTDPDTNTPGTVDATRYFTFGGSTVATATSTGGAAPVWALLFGDIQGSAQVMMELVVDTGETTGFETASSSHTITRDAYMPYGAERGGSDLDIDRGWLGQVEDKPISEGGTGLTYLNARYYDPAIGRFLSPDPLMNPGDPRTLDPYRYADNNPIVYTDASGLAPSCSGLKPGTTAYNNCNNYSKDTHNYITGKTVVQNNIDKAKGGSSSGGKKSGGSTSVSEPVVVGTPGGFLDGLFDEGSVFDTGGRPYTPSLGGHTQGHIMYFDDATIPMGGGPRWSDLATRWTFVGAYSCALIPEGCLALIGAGGYRWEISARAPRPPTSRLVQDVAVNPIAPAVLSTSRPIGLSATQNAIVQRQVATLRRAGAQDIRINQQQVNVDGVLVGINRPDLQYTMDGRRYYVEFETPGSTRGPGHVARISANDPSGMATWATVP